MFSLCRYSTRSQVVLEIPLLETTTEQKSLSFLAPKMYQKC